MSGVADENARKRLGDLYDFVIEHVTSQSRVELFRTVINDELKRVMKETGLDITGFTHVIGKSAIRHIVKNHGDDKRELQRGQIAITREDFVRLVDIIDSPDTIVAAGRTKVGRETVRYTKTGTECTVYVAELRTGRRQLAAVTLYKTKERKV